MKLETESAVVNVGGVVRYDPKRGKNTKRNKWWCVIDLPIDDLPDYAIWHIERNWWQLDNSSIKRTYLKPGWRMHISVIRGEEPRVNKSSWGRYMGNVAVPVRYEFHIKQATAALASKEPDGFWFIPAYWNGYIDLRQHFGLPVTYRGKPHKLHITVARVETK